jgi:uncharacterized protein GlcG (DUF336 family)
MTHISQGAALRAINAGLAKAAELNEPSSVAVVDAGGNLLAFARSDESAFGTIEIAISKAYTSASFKVRCDDLLADSQPGGECYGLLTANTGRPYVVFGGGIPIMANGKCIGAVGVSGGPVKADVAIAEAMHKSFETV